MSSAGESIGGRYRLIAELGAGGMGRVWKARDLTLEVDVAIKEVRLEPSASAEERAQRLARAQREARSAAQLREHPNVITVYDVLVEDQRPWIVMNLVQGGSLADLMREHGALAAPQALRIARSLLSALTAAHGSGIVHRDVKPANVLLTEGGEVLLTDFGIAKRADDTALTGTGFIGSLEYVAPERARGAPDAPPGDLFSLGATLYHAVTGASPFRRNHPAASLAALLSVRPARPEGAGELADLIMALLAKEPTDRPTAAQALEQLSVREQAALFAAPTQTRRPAPAPQAPAPQAPAPQAPASQAPAPQAPPQAPALRIAVPPADAALLSVMQLPAQRLRMLSGHRSLIVALAFSPDGQILAGAGADGAVHLWNVATGARAGTLAAHTADVRCLAFSPDGALLASGSADETARVWDLRYGRHFVLPGHSGAVESVAFSPAAAMLASGGDDGVVRLWDVRTGACVHELSENLDLIYTLAFGVEGNTLAGAGGPSDLVIWDPRTGSRLRRVRFDNADLSCFLYGPRGEIYVGVHGRGRQHLEEVTSGRPKRAVTGPVREICCVTLSSGGRVAVTGDMTGVVQFWDTLSGSELARIDEQRSRKGTAAVLGAALSRDGARLAVAGDDGRVALYGAPRLSASPY